MAAGLLLTACGGQTDERRAAELSVRGSESPADRPDEQELPDVPGEPPTADNLAGIWLVDGAPTGQWGALLVRFGADGTVTFDNGGWVDTEPAVLGTYEIDGDVITFTGGPESLEECVGPNGAWRAGIPEEGKLHAVVGEAGCELSRGVEWTWTRVSPSSPAGSEISSGVPVDEAFPLNTAVALRGIWLLEGGGHLLRMTSGTGAYALDGSGELGSDDADTGTFRLDGEGRVVFTSGASSRFCGDGDEQIWEDVRAAGRSLRATVVADACGHDLGTELTWVRTSP